MCSFQRHYEERKVDQTDVAHKVLSPCNERNLLP